MTTVGFVQHTLALLLENNPFSSMYLPRCEEGQAVMVVFFVVPPKKSVEPTHSVLQTPKAIRIIRMIFHCFEAAFRIWIVVTGIGTAMAFPHLQTL